jgi:hypothetical protein
LTQVQIKMITRYSNPRLGARLSKRSEGLGKREEKLTTISERRKFKMKIISLKSHL